MKATRKVEKDLKQLMEKLSAMIGQYPDGAEKENLVLMCRKLADAASILQEQAMVQQAVIEVFAGGDEEVEKIVHISDQNNFFIAIGKLQEAMELISSGESPEKVLREAGAEICMRVAEKEKDSIRTIHHGTVKEKYVTETSGDSQRLIEYSEARLAQVWEDIKDQIAEQRRVRMRLAVQAALFFVVYGTRDLSYTDAFGMQAGAMRISVLPIKAVCIDFLIEKAMEFCGEASEEQSGI